MSEYCSYSSVRIEIPWLKGKSYNETYSFFKKLLGEPEELDIFDGEVNYFCYGRNSEYRVVTDGDRWGIDSQISYEYGEVDVFTVISVEEALKTAQKVDQKLGQHVPISNVKVVSYNWYNGVEEPIEF